MGEDETWTCVACCCQTMVQRPKDDFSVLPGRKHANFKRKEPMRDHAKHPLHVRNMARMKLPSLPADAPPIASMLQPADALLLTAFQNAYFLARNELPPSLGSRLKQHVQTLGVPFVEGRTGCSEYFIREYSSSDTYKFGQLFIEEKNYT